MIQTDKYDSQRLHDIGSRIEASVRKDWGLEIIEAASEIDDQATEIEQLEEALYLALEYWTHRQQRYKNRTPAWVQKARAALSGEPK